MESFFEHEQKMHTLYTEAINSFRVQGLYTLSHKQLGSYPTGFVVIHTEPLVADFSFTVCPLHLCSCQEPTLPGNNPHDVVFLYKKEYGTLESVLYTLYERYKETGCMRTEYSVKRFVVENTLPPRKIVIPCFKRKENLIPVLKRFQMIDLPKEGYRPQILLVEHSPIPELEQIAEEFQCEYIWIALDTRSPFVPTGQFNKALCYDKAFLFGMPAKWYLFHDNDILVPKNFWDLLDKNVKRANTQFLQPYTHRCLLNLKPVVAEMFREDLTLADQPLDDSMYADLTLSTGAPGGSLYLTRERYLDAGGHDPQFCWGYGPEDALFYHKLELLEPIAFADEPPIELIHLWHPPAQIQNPFRVQMDMFVSNFFKEKSVEWKRGYMEWKKGILKNLMPNSI
jgi:hypothetical protein